MRLPRGFADDVKNQADIIRVVSDYITLKKRGANYLACCPFHSEKTPSFNVHSTKGIYKCFGCGAGGSVFDFVMQIEGCSFPEAVRIVAEKCGIPIPKVEESEEARRNSHDREMVLKLNEWAAAFFEERIEAPGEGEKALEYVYSRGITDTTRKQFRIGYAPDSWDALIAHLKSKGASQAEIEKSGLVVIKEQGGCYDRFRGRVMFPIADSQNRVIAFGGRVIGEGEPKYLNSPETAVYTKGHNLYGLGAARSSVRESGFAVLVEGYLDCIIPYQEGVHNVVASLGTALTDSQVRLLRRYMESPKIIVNFDPDSAGQAATLRSISLLLAEGFKVNILRMPTDEDPDEYVRAHGVAAFRSLFAVTQPYMEFVFDSVLSRYDLSRPAFKVEAINAILPHLARMRDRVERLDYAEQLADRVKVDSRIIREEMKRVAAIRQPQLDPRRLREAAEITLAEKQLLELMLASSEIRRTMLANITEDDYRDLASGAIFEAIRDIEKNGLEIDYTELSGRLSSDYERELVPALMISDLSWAGGDDFDTLFRKATEALSSLRRRRVEKEKAGIQLEIARAEREGDHARVAELFRKKQEIVKRLHQLS